MIVLLINNKQHTAVEMNFKQIVQNKITEFSC